MIIFSYETVWGQCNFAANRFKFKIIFMLSLCDFDKNIPNDLKNTENAR